MEKTTISLFKGYSDKMPVDSSLEEIVQIIRCDAALHDRTEKYRHYLRQGWKRDADREKAGCPCFAVAVNFRGGKTRADICHWTGYTLVDLDHIPPGRMADIRKRVCDDRHTLLAYTTVSGAGIRVICRIEDLNGQVGEKRFRRYVACFNGVNDYYSRMVDFASDGQCKNATRLSGLAADPDVYFNPGALPFEASLPELSPVPQGGAPAAKAAAHKPAAPANKRLARAVRAAEGVLREEGIAYCDHHRNEYVMRMGYLLNRYGVPQKLAEEWARGRFTDYGGNVAAVMASCYASTEEHGTWSPGKKAPKAAEERYASVAAIEAFLTTQAEFRKNVVSGKCEVKTPEPDSGYVELTDRYVNTLWSRMGKAEQPPARISDIRAVLDSEYTPLFNPFEEYVLNLPPWDGTTDHIARLAAGVHVKENGHLFAPYFKKWLVAMIASLLDPQVVNHEILVLIGKQGIYKTTWMQRLLPDELQRYFYVKSDNRRISKDDLFTLTEFALVCLEELEEMSPAQVCQLKAITGMGSVNERAAYGHFKECRPHIASFCGTSNNAAFINDPSGTRRWLPFEVESIDNPFLHPVNYAGVYAQGYALWKSGFCYWLNPEEIAEISAHNRNFEVPCLERDLVQTYYRRPVPGEECVCQTNAQILGHINVGIRQPLSSTRLGMVMKQEGYEPVRFEGHRGYRVIQLKTDEIYLKQRAMARYT